jgi:hypothetical protein
MVLRRTDLCCLVELGEAGHEVLEAVLRHNELGQDCHVRVRTLHQDRLGFESFRSMQAKRSTYVTHFTSLSALQFYL